MRTVFVAAVALGVLMFATVAWSAMAGTLVVDARPSSTVMIDGEPMGETPVRTQLAEGEHEVRLRAPDGRERAFMRRVDAGRETTFRFHWR